MFAALPPPMPPGQTDPISWAAAFKNNWIVNPAMPLTVVSYPESVTMSPPCDPTVNVNFTRRMVAFPLTQNGPPGSVPNGQADWWQKYFSTSATGYSKRAWVQGHLLNHNVHGPGVAQNLVPITDALNRIMEKWCEKLIKARVQSGLILRYEVIAHWRGGSTEGTMNWLGNASKHALAMCKAFDGQHTKGECLAPTCVEWLASEITWDPSNSTWKEVQRIQFGGFDGIENGIFNNSWTQ